MASSDNVIKSWLGGARVGYWNATWPFARLMMTPDKLILKLLLSQELTFAKVDIDYFEVYRGSLPLIGKVLNGIGFIHRKPGYPERIIFWYSGDPKQLANEIVSRGFGSTAADTKLPFWFM
jgi:hypothetical protein